MCEAEQGDQEGNQPARRCAGDRVDQVRKLQLCAGKPKRARERGKDATTEDVRSDHSYEGGRAEECQRGDMGISRGQQRP